MDSTGGESRMRKQAEEQLGRRSGMEWKMYDYICDGQMTGQGEFPQADLPRMATERRDKPMKEHRKSKRRSELMKPRTSADIIKSAGGLKVANKRCANKYKKNKATQDEEDVFLAEAEKTVGSSNSASESMETLRRQLLLIGMPNKFNILETDGDDVKDEMVDRGKSFIEEGHMPSDFMHQIDEDEEYVTVGSSKSSVDQDVISLDTEESATEAEEEEELESGKRSEMVGMRSQMQRTSLVGVNIQDAETQRAVHAGHNKLGKKEKRKQRKKAKAEAKAKANDEEDGKHVASVTDAGIPEESVTESEQAVKKEAKDGSLLVELNSTGAESSILKEAEEEPVPVYYSGMTPEYRDELMKHNAARAAAMHKLLYGHEKLPESSKRIENSEGKRLSDVMRISTEKLHTKVRKALLDIEDKLAKKSRNMDKETLQLLEDVSSMLDQGGDDDNKEDEIYESAKSATPLAKMTAAEKEMADEEERFDEHRRLWEYKHGTTCGFFKDATVLSSMQFTHYTPGRRPYSSDCATPETLQIISIKLSRLADGLGLPLSVYGLVAVRDMVDRNRNILFFRDRSEAQKLKQNDPFLHLIGPSRAIVFTDKVWIEVELRVKGRTYSQDKALISSARCYTGGNGPGVSTICFRNVLCMLELCLQPVKQTVQATILGVQVARNVGSWPLKYGGLVTCSPLSGKYVFGDNGFTRIINPSSSQIVLIESEDEAMLRGESGYVHLWRQVVSVELEGRLDVGIKAYSESGAIAVETCVPFDPKVCNISEKKCALGDAEVTITVAWSLVAASKTGLSLELSGRRCV